MCVGGGGGCDPLHIRELHVPKMICITIKLDVNYLFGSTLNKTFCIQCGIRCFDNRLPYAFLRFIDTFLF